jgi:basic membrane protein A
MMRVVAVLIAFGLVSCAHARVSHQVRVGLVTSIGGLGDHSYNDSAYAGLLEAQRELGVGIAVMQSRSAADYQPNLLTFANLGFDEIVGNSYDMAEDLTEVAGLFPQRRFAMIDSTVDAPNVTSVLFRSEQGSFLAGALAAMVTRTKTVGYLGGVDSAQIESFRAGYLAGVRAIDPSVNVLVKYVGSWDDVPAAKEIAGTMYAQGADIIYAVAGKDTLGVIDQARGRAGAYVIGVDVDQDDIAPGKILTSVLKRIDRAVFTLAQDAVAHRDPPSRLILGLREGGVSLTDFRYSRNVVTDAMIARLAVLRAKIISGEIAVPDH